MLDNRKMNVTIIYDSGAEEHYNDVVEYDSIKLGSVSFLRFRYNGTTELVKVENDIWKIKLEKIDADET